MEQIGVSWSLKDCTDIGIFPFSLIIAIINISISLQTQILLIATQDFIYTCVVSLTVRQLGSLYFQGSVSNTTTNIFLHKTFLYLGFILRIDFQSKGDWFRR